ncbi:MAG: hypothetical protein M0Z69_01800 [Actinomycetota bacterium]|nr:hypothetical protein [Actinomycetota bacterium]
MRAQRHVEIAIAQRKVFKLPENLAGLVATAQGTSLALKGALDALASENHPSGASTRVVREGHTLTTTVNTLTRLLNDHFHINQ